MKIKIPYRNVVKIKWMIVLLMIIISGCGRKEQKHNNHQPAFSTGIDSSLQLDSMPGMNMGNNNNHDSNYTIPDSNTGTTATQTDFNQNGTYWNALPTNRTVIARQQIVEPTYVVLDFLINGNGYIAFDMRRNRKVPVRVGGRIERLYVKYNYQYVRKGEKILELYSPELNTYVEEYLYIRQKTTDSILQERAKQKLLLLGLTLFQVNQINQTGHASFTIPVYSPFDGYVLFNPSSSTGMGNRGNDAGGMGGGMNGEKKSSVSVPGSVVSDNSIREGMYLNKDQTLFWINDFKVAWGIIAFNKGNEKYVRKGQAVTVKSELLPEKPIKTSIQLIEQVYEGGQKFTQARVYLTNTSGILKQNSLITASVSMPVKSFVIPASSVYYLGKIAIVWVRVGTTKEGNNIFQSRAVRTGHRSEDKIEILEGLKQNEAVAKDAGYLADSETIIKY